MATPPRRMPSSPLDLNRAPSARNAATRPSGSAGRPERPSRSVRRPGTSIPLGRVVAFFALLAVLAAGAWILLRGRKGDAPMVAQWSGTGTRHALLVALDTYDKASYQELGIEAARMDRKGSGKADLKSMEGVCRKLGDWTDVVTLYDSQATRAQIRDHLARFAEKLQPGEDFLFFISSHGNAEGPDKKNDAALAVYDGLYEESEFREDILRFKKGVRPVVVLSACHSAAMYEQRLRGGSGEGSFVFDAKGFLERMTADHRVSLRSGNTVSTTDIGWICSASSDQSSYRTMNHSGSVFASYLIAREGWMGGAADGLTKSVIGMHGWEAVSSTKTVLGNYTTLRQEPTGRVSFLDLALYAVRKSGAELNVERSQNEIEVTQTIPQFANPAVLNAVVAGRTGSVASVDRSAPNAPNAPNAEETEGNSESASTDEPANDPRAVCLDDDAKAAAVADIPNSYRKAVREYLFPSPEEVFNWFEIVRDSDFVLKNVAYKHYADNTRFRYDETSNEVNAFASRVDETAREIHANMNILGGFVRFSRVVGAVMASGSLAGPDAPARLELLLTKIAPVGGFLPAEKAVALLRDCGVSPSWFLNEAFVQEARNISNGIGMACTAHEMGHVMYGHIWQTDAISAETSRNNERDADSFSYSVSSEEKTYAMGGISKYMFMGNVYLMLAWTAQDALDVAAEAKKRGVSDPADLADIRAEMMQKKMHPYSGERLVNLLKSKEDMAKQYGLDVAAISEGLRKLGIY